MVQSDLYLYITEDGKGDKEVTLESAQKWKYCKIINDDKGNPYKVEQPGLDFYSWMTIDELKQAYKWYKKYAKLEGYGDDIPLEYKAILKNNGSS